jgi:hypothetical protein
MVGLTKASSFAIKRETVAGTYVAPTVGTDFLALRPGNELSFEPEILESDELLNDIGATKGLTGKEAVSGSHSAYLRHSGVEGQEPQLGLLWESIMGSKSVNATEYPTVAASTTTVIKVNTGVGANFQEGESLLVKDATNGYSIRNVKSISGDDLTLNFALTAAPTSAINLGKSCLYVPTAGGHPTFSTTKYLGGGFAKEVSAGNTVTEVSITADANGFGEVEFSFEGTKYYYNPIEITSSTRFLDVTDDSGTFAVSVPVGIYATPIDLATALQTALENANAETYSVVYNNSTGKFIITSPTNTLLSLLFNTGANTANSIATKIGFTTAANKTGAGGVVGYTSDNAQVYTSGLTPSYDSADAIVIKGAELFVGNQTDNLCICAQSVSLTISKTVEDVDCICEATGVLEKIPTARAATMSVTAVLKQHDAGLLDALLKNSGISAMFNAGPKSGGNWIAGRCFNAYFRNCTVSSYKTTGDSFLQVEMELKGYVTSNSKDIYVSFI